MSNLANQAAATMSEQHAGPARGQGQGTLPPSQHHQHQSRQLPSEKKGSGILIRTLKRGRVSSKTGTYSYAPPRATVVIHYEAWCIPFDAVTVTATVTAVTPDTDTENDGIVKHANDMERILKQPPFDSSLVRNQPLVFEMGRGQVIYGIEVAITNMCVEEKAEVTIPYAFGYGVQGYPPVVPPRSTLVFHIHFLSYISI